MKKNVKMKLLLSACIIMSGAMAAACDFNWNFLGEDSGSTFSEEKISNNSTLEDSSLGDDATPEDSAGDTLQNMDYSVSVQSVGGMRFSDISVCFLDGDTLIKQCRVDDNGTVTVTLPQKTYTIEVVDLPLGYYQQETVTVSGDSLNADVLLSIKLVDKADRPASFKYQVGDVMHDFTIPTLDGELLTLSEILEEKEMVLLNFWYTTCSHCLTELPWLNSAYNLSRFAGKFEMIAVHHSSMATVQETEGFVSSQKWDFKVSHGDLTDIEKYFQVSGYPTTVIIDRYGVVAFMETGRFENQTECNYVIEQYLKVNYKQDFTYGGGIVEVPPTVDTEVTVDAPSNEDVNKALGTSGLTYTLDENPYVWPFVVAEVDGRDCLMASNGSALGVDAHNTSSLLSVKVNVPEMDDYTDYTFMFDYKISSEYDADFLYVLVDGVIVQAYSGPEDLQSEWKTSYAYVPVRSGEHTLTFVYYKDSAVSEGEDTVYIDNLRFAPIGEGQTQVYRDAATNRNNNNDGFKIPSDTKDSARFDKYVNVYYNESDKLYHVHSENGPLLLANLVDTGTNWSQYPLWDYFAVGGYLKYLYGNEIFDLKFALQDFANAEYQSLNGYVPVNQELKNLFEFITVKFGSGYEDEWLEFCCYYDAYNCEDVENPCAGVTFEYAIEIPADGIDAVGDEVRATVDLKVVLSPRGYKYAFTPTVSGVYQVSSSRSISADSTSLDPIVWITSEYFEYDQFGSVVFPYTDNAKGDFSLNLYMTAGTTYYIAAADSDPYKLGDKYEIVISYVGG